METYRLSPVSGILALYWSMATLHASGGRHIQSSDHLDGGTLTNAVDTIAPRGAVLQGVVPSDTGCSLSNHRTVENNFIS